MSRLFYYFASFSMWIRSTGIEWENAEFAVDENKNVDEQAKKLSLIFSIRKKKRNMILERVS